VAEVTSLSTSVSYRDVLGETRTLDVHVRLPVVSSGPLPVVIWSPDSTTLRPARETLLPWSEATARAGYMTVTISHPVRDQTRNGAVSLAGAKRLLTTEDRRNADDLSDPRVAAVVSLSPQGPLNEGFFDADAFKPATSWLTVGRPVLMATGSGDTTAPLGRSVEVETRPCGGAWPTN
jgi:hypothetical protein